MCRALASRIVAMAALLGVFLAAVVLAQSGAGGTGQTPPSSTDTLLSEIKALRADLNQRLETNIRAQLLVARLQLQEQRITTLSRQLTDVQQQLQTNERVRAPLEAQLKMFEAAPGTDAEKKEGNFMLTTLSSQLELMAKADDELKRQQAYLSGLMTEEQSRWTAFNAQLEELERLLTSNARPPRDR